MKSIVREGSRWVLPLAFALLGGCVSMAPRGCRTGEQLEVDDTLYFGNSTPHGEVSQDEWARFLATTVTPRFPQGLSVMEASGQWRSASGAISKEASRILNIVHADDGSSERAITEIMSAYKVQYQQEAVLRVKTDACVSF